MSVAPHRSYIATMRKNVHHVSSYRLDATVVGHHRSSAVARRLVWLRSLDHQAARIEPVSRPRHRTLFPTTLSSHTFALPPPNLQNSQSPTNITNTTLPPASAFYYYYHQQRRNSSTISSPSSSSSSSSGSSSHQEPADNTSSTSSSSSSSSTKSARPEADNFILEGSKRRKEWIGKASMFCFVLALGYMLLAFNGKKDLSGGEGERKAFLISRAKFFCAVGLVGIVYGAL